MEGGSNLQFNLLPVTSITLVDCFEPLKVHLSLVRSQAAWVRLFHQLGESNPRVRHCEPKPDYFNWLTWPAAGLVWKHLKEPPVYGGFMVFLSRVSDRQRFCLQMWFLVAVMETLDVGSRGHRQDTLAVLEHPVAFSFVVLLVLPAWLWLENTLLY